jgi:hypothetical protein
MVNGIKLITLRLLISSPKSEPGKEFTKSLLSHSLSTLQLLQKTRPYLPKIKLLILPTVLLLTTFATAFFFESEKKRSLTTYSTLPEF